MNFLCLDSPGFTVQLISDECIIKQSAVSECNHCTIRSRHSLVSEMSCKAQRPFTESLDKTKQTPKNNNNTKSEISTESRSQHHNLKIKVYRNKRTTKFDINI